MEQETARSCRSVSLGYDIHPLQRSGRDALHRSYVDGHARIDCWHARHVPEVTPLARRVLLCTEPRRVRGEQQFSRQRCISSFDRGNWLEAPVALTHEWVCVPPRQEVQRESHASQERLAGAVGNRVAWVTVSMNAKPLRTWVAISHLAPFSP